MQYVSQNNEVENAAGDEKPADETTVEPEPEG